MAQALYDQHPLQEYLRESGDLIERTIPGGLDVFPDMDEAERQEYIEFWSATLDSWLQNARSFFSHSHKGSPNREFAERFKYIVISSSLLSASLPTAPTSTAVPAHPPSSRLPPGDWNHHKQGHETAAELHESSTMLWLVPLMAAGAAASFSTFVSAILFILAALKYGVETSHTLTPTSPLNHLLEALDALITASDVWDSAISEGMGVLERDEQNGFRDPGRNGSSPNLPLRLALQSAFDTTHTQSDTVRQLFSPLTAHLELSMLSEMYAPSTPFRAAFSANSGYDVQRRTSSASAIRTSSSHGNLYSENEKRSTWSGGTTIRRGPKSSRLAVELGDSFGNAQNQTPPSPSITSLSSEGDNEDTFGSSALSLQRKKRRAAASAQLMRAAQVDGDPFTALPPLHTSNTRSAPNTINTKSPSQRAPLTTPSSPSSRFLTLQATRNPHSLATLRSSLQSALSSRRYAASHLLALRFDEDADDPYWEDVVSLVTLLTSTLEDAAGGLSEALDDAAERRMAEQLPSPPCYPTTPTSRGLLSAISPMPMSNSGTSMSFAPMPSHLTNFVTHMDVVSRAMDAAKAELDKCLLAAARGDDSEEGLAMLSYARLRKELGVALRECERGRGALIGVVHGEAPLSDEEDAEEPAEVDLGDGNAALDDSDAAPLPQLGGSPSSTVTRASVVFTPEDDDQAGDDVGVFDDDDGAVGGIRVPPMPEQIFESEIPAEGPVWERERSKLSREERIKLAKERRAAPPTRHSSGDIGRTGGDGGHGEAWGPGGDVVQELKSVINLVGEKRRKTLSMSGSTSPSPKSPLSSGNGSPLGKPHRPTRPPPPQPKSFSIPIPQDSGRVKIPSPRRALPTIPSGEISTFTS